MKSKGSKRAIFLCLMVLLIGVFGFSTYKVLYTKITGDREQNAFNELAAIVEERKEQTVSAQTKSENSYTETESDFETEPAMLPWYAPLYERNTDLFGWLSISGTIIDYPVMYTPKDSEYYLRRNFDGDDAVSGTLFVDGHCRDDGNFYLIHGHHMRNKTMFGTLPKYGSEAYCREHPAIIFDTLYEHREYTVMAAFYSEVYDREAENVFRYYEYTDLSDKAVFEEYVARVKSLSAYDTGITAEYGDELITLSTCSKHTDDGRFVVVAKRVA